eukprot:5861778-Heterocapsa_arctica.AAC.1
MKAIIGMVFQKSLRGSVRGDWALYIAFPLRALESKCSVQALGLTGSVWDDWVLYIAFQLRALTIKRG